jgi:alpha-ribazole phosphatase
MRLLLVRHGQTLYNQQSRYTGQSDIPLSPQGKRQATLLAQRLLKEPLNVIVASDLQRASNTAQIIAEPHTLPVYEDPALREMSLGAWEGSTYAEILAQDEAFVTLWRTDPINYAPPGGETVAQLNHRIADSLQRWHSQYPESTVLWVTHAGVIGTLICYLLDIDLNNRRKFRCDTTSITEFDIGPDYAILMRTNDTAHLQNIGLD